MKDKTKLIIDKLIQQYPEAKCSLEFKSPFQLLVATILSAQTTDIKVNQVTQPIFKQYPTLDKFLELSQEEIEQKIKKLGLYRNKSKNLYNMCRQLKEQFNGQVPDEMEKLISLAGVGRKTANVVLSNAFNKPAIAVDTHVFRVANRIGLAKAKNPLNTEKQLQKAIDEQLWSYTHHLLIFHGRKCCHSRKPNCDECILKNECHYFSLKEENDEENI